jgi:branched-chain amino acid transport system permease protein
MIIYSLMLIILMIFKPTGLMGSYDFSLSQFIEKIGGFAMRGKTSGGGKAKGDDAP